MQYTTLANQPYTQATPTETPIGKLAQIAEYDAAEVGSYIHWSGWWQSYNQGTVQWASDWKSNEYRRNGRERLMVVAVPERVTEHGVDCDGGLVLLSIERWTGRLYRPAGQEFDGMSLPALDETHEECLVSVVASTGIRYRQPVDQFIANVVQRREAERALDRAIAEQSDERNDW